MTKKEFEDYYWCSNTMVKVDGEWSGVNEVWFVEGMIGVKATGKLVTYSEIQEIKLNT